MRTILVAATLVVSVTAARAQECYTLPPPDDAITECGVPFYGPNDPNARVPMPAIANVLEDSALACRGTDVFNKLAVMQGYPVQDLLTKRLNDGFCIMLRPFTRLTVAETTHGAVCLAAPKITPLPANDRYKESPCLWTRVGDLHFVLLTESIKGE